ncbi:MAG: hypothetical protein C0402_09930 [Thermodesulfovibrio sp.]|nr:hypothetical protein [Thermodesulfovibrio sp.]
MLKKIINKQLQPAKSREKELATLEITEIHAITDRLITRLESRLKVLESAEKRVDEKLEKLERLIEKAELLQKSAGDAPARSHETKALVQNLVQQGLKVDEIARVLNIPKGEIELILSLNR